MANEASDKTERLINLILALLSAKKFLTKSQIFDVVMVRGEAAYQGSDETKDRMFERDKDDLRGMGITIEVGGLDPLFDDEAGYRIKESQYGLRMPDLSPAELATLSVAANFWRDSAFSSESQSALRRLNSLGIPADNTEMGLIELRYRSTDENFEIINEAIESKRLISFTYSGSSLSDKTVEPYALLLWNGFWYLFGRDIDINQIRMYKLVRFVSGVATTGKSNAFGIPSDFDAVKHLKISMDERTQSALIRIRTGAALALASKGREIERDESWVAYEIAFESHTSFAQTCLWFGSDVEVKEPITLREHIKRLLVEVSNG